MNRNMIAALLAATMIAAAMAPLASADRDPHDKHKTATGPVSGMVEKSIGAGLTVCFTDPTFPVAPCVPNPGGVSSLGGAFFDVDGTDSSKDPATDPQNDPKQNWNCPLDVPVGPNPCGFAGRETRIWVETAAGSVGEGFLVVACSDGDDDDVCQGGNPVDVQVHGYASGVTGDNGNPCDDGKDKDKKDCESGFEAEVYFCVRRDNWSFTDPLTGIVTTDTSFDDFVIFIGAYQDSVVLDFGEKSNGNGVGATVGSFDIYAEYLDFLSDESCEYENTGDDPATEADEGDWPDWDQPLSAAG